MKYGHDVGRRAGTAITSKTVDAERSCWHMVATWRAKPTVQVAGVIALAAHRQAEQDSRWLVCFCLTVLRCFCVRSKGSMHSMPGIACTMRRGAEEQIDEPTKGRAP